jgi:hypothetical protein
MAIINKTGITNGGTIQSEHITRVIDALSGVSTDSLLLTGSMTGSLFGTLTGTASFATSASRAVSASFATSSSRSVSSSFASTASYAVNAGGEYLTLDFIHTPKTGTTTGNISAFGTFPEAVHAEGRIAAYIPFSCSIVSASLSTHCVTPGSTAKVNYDLVWYGASSYLSESLGYVNLTNFIPTLVDGNRRPIGVNAEPGKHIYIKMKDSATDASVVYSSHVSVLIKKI